MEGDSELVKSVIDALRPLLAEGSITPTSRRAAYAIARAYRKGQFTVPIEQLKDSDLLTLQSFGVRMLSKFREIIPRPGDTE